jgi:hypothetical protein
MGNVSKIIIIDVVTASYVIYVTSNGCVQIPVEALAYSLLTTIPRTVRRLI